ncbi:MAG: glycosyltransferase family 9 protein, partial [Thermodesulfobacteriota bacterium]
GATTRGLKRILIIRLSAIGDVVRTLPAINALRQRFPAAHIAWVAEEKARDVLSHQPEIDEVIVFQRSRWKKGILNPLSFLRTIGEVYRFVKELRGKHYDIAFDFHGIFKSGLISYVSGAKERVGFDRGYCKEWNHLFNNRRVSPPSNRISRFERNFALLGSLGLGGGRREVSLHVPQEDVDYVDQFFRDRCPGMSGPLIAIHPGTSPKTTYKRWASAKYSELADRLVEELNVSVLFTWGPGEKAMVDEVRARMRRDSILAPETRSLKQLAEIFRRCSIYIGNDTGPMHIASLVKTPVVGIYGPTDPIVNAPYDGTSHIIVRKDLPCSPCRNRGCKDVECMEAISSQDVFDAAKMLLGLRDNSAK